MRRTMERNLLDMAISPKSCSEFLGQVGRRYVHDKSERFLGHRLSRALLAFMYQ